jgi:hypothetical protein
MESILAWLLAYLVGISGTVGAVCYFDAIPCGGTGDTRNWLLQLIAVVVSLIAGNKFIKK